MNWKNLCMKCMTESLNEEGKCANCNAIDELEENKNHHLPVRTILKGKYAIGRVIGEGGFGITYIAYDLDLEIRVAIKEFCIKDAVGRESEDGLTLYPYSESNARYFEKEKQKFINEARRLAKFRNEGGVVSVLDYFLENQTAYIVMDYIDGITLRNYLKQIKNTKKQTMGISEALYLFYPVMETLAKIHKSNIVHRDISPDNIMISKDFTKVYLIDFGTARDLEDGYTLSEYSKGFYTPVEQMDKKMKQGPWTDVYALCATIYFCITGRKLSVAISRLTEDDIIKPSKLGIEIPQCIEETLLKGLAVMPEARIQSMEELMQGFEKETLTEEHRAGYEFEGKENKAAGYSVNLEVEHKLKDDCEEDSCEEDDYEEDDYEEGDYEEEDYEEDDYYEDDFDEEAYLAEKAKKEAEKARREAFIAEMNAELDQMMKEKYGENFKEKSESSKEFERMFGSGWDFDVEKYREYMRQRDANATAKNVQNTNSVAANKNEEDKQAGRKTLTSIIVTIMIILALCIGFYLFQNRTARRYNDDGSYEIATYQNGKIVRIDIYQENGLLSAMGEWDYEEDSHVYTYYYYDSANKLIKKEIKENGIMTEMIEYMENGNIRNYIHEDENKFSSYEKSPDGTLLVKNSYIDGNLRESILYDWPQKGWWIHYFYEPGVDYNATYELNYYYHTGELYLSVAKKDNEQEKFEIVNQELYDLFRTLEVTRE